MLKSLKLKNLTVFPEADFEFGKNLNVFIGENGTGKTHLLKTLYALQKTLAVGKSDQAQNGPTKSALQNRLADELYETFKPDALGRLVRRQKGRNRCEIACAFHDPSLDLAISFNTASKNEVGIDQVPLKWMEKRPAFILTHDLMQLYPGFISLYELNRLPIDGIWRDTCLLLGAPLAKGPREKRVQSLLKPLEKAMGGTIELEGDRFYLNTNSGRIEMNMVSEGHRKLAMLARLIATGGLLDKGTLFWDEPETNLNPKIVKLVARTIVDLCSRDIQVFLSSHSLFLLREIYILQKSEFGDLDSKFFGLHREGDQVLVRQGKDLDDVGDIAALDEDLQQSNRYMDVEWKANDERR